MARADEIEQAIADINSALDSGATSHSSDGQSTTFDQGALLRRKQALQDELDTLRGNPPTRPISYNIDMSGGVW